MKELVMIIRPEKLEAVKQIVDEMNYGGMTITTVMGCGSQKGDLSQLNELRGLKVSINLLPKIQVSVVVEDDDVEALIMSVQEKISTGHVGDGKIFIKPIDNAIRIRTGERGAKAL